MKKIIYFIIALAIIVMTYIIGHFFGSHTFYMAADVRADGTETVMYPHCYNTEEAFLREREVAKAALDALHRFYCNDDNEQWFEEFIPTKEYQKLDSALEHDWEDFYYYETPQLENWEAVYGCSFEPVQEIKDSIRYARYEI